MVFSIFFAHAPTNPNMINISFPLTMSPGNRWWRFYTIQTLLRQCVISRSRTSRLHLFSFPLFPQFFLPLFLPLPASFYLHLTLSYPFLSFSSFTLPHSHPTTPHPTPPLRPYQLLSLKGGQSIARNFTFFVLILHYSFYSYNHFLHHE